MKLVDYTGKINSHDEYLEILKKLEKKSQYIEYVLVDETDTKFINKLHNNFFGWLDNLFRYM